MTRAAATGKGAAMIRPLSAAEKAENWAACRKYLRRYFVACLVPVLALIWGAGYGQGILAGYREVCGPETMTQGLTK